MIEFKEVKRQRDEALAKLGRPTTQELRDVEAVVTTRPVPQLDGSTRKEYALTNELAMVVLRTNREIDDPDLDESGTNRSIHAVNPAPFARDMADGIWGTCLDPITINYYEDEALPPELINGQTRCYAFLMSEIGGKLA